MILRVWPVVTTPVSPTQTHLVGQWLSQTGQIGRDHNSGETGKHHRLYTPYSPTLHTARSSIARREAKKPTSLQPSFLPPLRQPWQDDVLHPPRPWQLDGSVLKLYPPQGWLSGVGVGRGTALKAPHSQVLLGCRLRQPVCWVKEKRDSL